MGPYEVAVADSWEEVEVVLIGVGVKTELYSSLGPVS